MIHSLLLHEITHLAFTLLAAGVVFLWLKWRKIRKKGLFMFIVLGAFIGEFFMDTDHLFDYFLAYGFNFRLDYFFNGVMFIKLHKTFVLFHSWELILIVGICAWYIKKITLKYFLMALLMGMLLHLVYDTFYNNYSFLGYSLIFRALHGFNFDYFSVSS